MKLRSTFLSSPLVLMVRVGSFIGTITQLGQRNETMRQKKNTSVECAGIRPGLKRRLGPFICRLARICPVDEHSQWAFAQLMSCCRTIQWHILRPANPARKPLATFLCAARHPGQ